MASWKCAQCMLVNKDTDQVCRRCQTASDAPNQLSNGPGAGTRVTPVYGLPRNQGPALPSLWGEPTDDGAASANVWREGDLLVMQRDASLPNRCMKCNAPTEISTVQTFRQVDSTLGWLRYIPYLRYVYWIARVASNQTAEVGLWVCQTHHSQMTMLSTTTKILRIAGITTMIYGFYIGSLLWLVGLLAAIIGTVLAASRPVAKLSRMDDYYLWLKGVDSEYLAALPVVPR